MKKLILFVSFITITITSKAQIHEIGLFFGGSNYVGDVGSELYINPNNLMGGLMYKWNINPRMALRGTFTYAEISADDAKASNKGRQLRGLRFTNSIKELAVGLEYNFFEYNLSDYRYTQTPYLLLQLATFNYKTVTREIAPQQYEYNQKIGVSIPFGLGYKTKIFRDAAIAFEVRATYTFTDELDYNNQNIPELSFGNPNSNDWYMFSGISFVYTFGRPPCYETPY